MEWGAQLAPSHSRALSLFQDGSVLDIYGLAPAAPASSRVCQGRSTPFLSKPSRDPAWQLPPHAELFIAPTWGCVCPEMGRWPWDSGVTRGTG